MFNLFSKFASLLESYIPIEYKTYHFLKPMTNFFFTELGHNFVENVSAVLKNPRRVFLFFNNNNQTMTPFTNLTDMKNRFIRACGPELCHLMMKEIAESFSHFEIIDSVDDFTKYPGCYILIFQWNNSPIEYAFSISCLKI